MPKRSSFVLFSIKDKIKIFTRQGRSKVSTELNVTMLDRTVKFLFPTQIDLGPGNEKKRKKPSFGHIQVRTKKSE